MDVDSASAIVQAAAAVIVALAAMLGLIINDRSIKKRVAQAKKEAQKLNLEIGIIKKNHSLHSENGKEN